MVKLTTVSKAKGRLFRAFDKRGRAEHLFVSPRGDGFWRGEMGQDDPKEWKFCRDESGVTTFAYSTIDDDKGNWFDATLDGVLSGIYDLNLPQ